MSGDVFAHQSQDESRYSERHTELVKGRERKRERKRGKGKSMGGYEAKREGAGEIGRILYL